MNKGLCHRVSQAGPEDKPSVHHGFGTHNHWPHCTSVSDVQLIKVHRAGGRLVRSSRGPPPAARGLRGVNKNVRLNYISSSTDLLQMPMYRNELL